MRRTYSTTGSGVPTTGRVSCRAATLPLILALALSTSSPADASRNLKQFIPQQQPQPQGVGVGVGGQLNLGAGGGLPLQAGPGDASGGMMGMGVGGDVSGGGMMTQQPNAGLTSVSDPSLINLMQHGRQSSASDSDIRSRLSHVKDILHGHAKTLHGHAKNAGAVAARHAGMIHERNPDMHLFFIAFLLAIIAIGSSFAKTISKLKRDALHRELALEVMRSQTQEDLDKLLEESRADENKRENRRELARLMREADFKRMNVKDELGGGGGGEVDGDNNNEGRKNHLKDMQASLAELKEKMKSGKKSEPRPKRETRAVRKDK